jgi:hypothetical protein
MLSKDVWDIINSGGSSTKRENNVTRVQDGSSFKALPMKKHERINDLIANEEKKHLIKAYGGITTLDDVKRRASTILVRAKDYGFVDRGGLTGSAFGGTGGTANYSTMAGVRGQDPLMNVGTTANIWLSPYESNAIYTQGGIPEIVINKKSQSVLLNGVQIKNPKLSAEQLDRISLDMVKTGLAQQLADSIRDSLIYGGTLLFPHFRYDTPATTPMTLEQLVRFGVVGKDCISYFTRLDRWNVVHIPQYNPTMSDFERPRMYYIPFMGADVNAQRCARIISAPSAGYYGMMLSMGWGTSNIPSWIQSYYNYDAVSKVLGTMINQMSILARTIPLDSGLATEGSLFMDLLAENETMRVREMSVNNPVQLDILGELQAVNRDFGHVPELIRLIRQDLAARTSIPEELFFSSEQGAFSSDTTGGELEKQLESLKTLHMRIGEQLKPIAQLCVINALGIGREVIAALPYTTITFANPKLANATAKSDVAAKVSKAAFDLVAAGTPLSSAIEIVHQLSDDEFDLTADFLKELDERQATNDQRASEEHDLNCALLEAQIEQTHEAAKHMGDKPAGAGGKSSSAKKSKSKDGNSYLDRLKQHAMEKLGNGIGTKKQGLEKAKTT